MNAIANLADKVLGKAETATAAKPLVDTTHPMRALTWHSKKHLQVIDVPRPLVTDQTDVVIKITATTICGSDLHLYQGSMPNLKDGDILGHECMGIVQDVGSEVQKIKKGQRVVVSFDIACGSCNFCQREEYTGCNRTNPSKLEREMYGHPTAGFFGYSHLTGGIPGGQAEYVRVPFADMNCLPVPDEVPDDKALYLSDIIPTSYHGAEMGGVKQGSTVAIWGLGPVGLLCARWCQLRGAARIVGIDRVEERLRVANTVLGIETIDFGKQDVVKTIQTMFPEGVDVGIECAGFDYAKTLTHKLEMAVGLETDTADMFNEMFKCVRPFGNVSVIGVYSGYANHFPVGAMMEKAFTIRGGQTPVQKYWRMALEKVRSGEFDPSFVVTHKGYLSDAPEWYKKFNEKADGVIKVFLRPDNTVIE
jgi:threonine dehydrogenase-like Zn-dependent dehydrogenase